MMTIKELNITFDQHMYFPGQTITGHVMIVLNKSTVVQSLELVITGGTSSTYKTGKHVTELDGKVSTRIVSNRDSETYLKYIIEFLGRKTELNPGEHKYPFTAFLSSNVPSSFSGRYGGIVYYGFAKVIRPYSPNKTIKTFFQVKNCLDLNRFPNLKIPQKRENSKRFGHFCSTSGPLSMVIHVPKTGYARSEKIPIIVDIENSSKMVVKNVKAILRRETCYAPRTYKESHFDEIRAITFGKVPANSSKTWNDSIALDSDEFPNIEDCNLITITHTLKVEADPKGAHGKLIIEIPLTIGDIPFHDEKSDLPPSYFNQLPVPYNFSSEVNPGHASRSKCNVS